MTKTLVAYAGEIIKVDDEIWSIVSRRNWYVNDIGYTYSNDKDKLSIHRVVYKHHYGEIPKGMFIDHINRNKLDNRIENLRLATPAQSSYNRPPNKNGSSQYKGVGWHKKGCKWQALIHKNDKSVGLGLFEDETLSALVYDYVACSVFGEFAYLNFPEITEYQFPPKLQKKLDQKIKKLLSNDENY